jgi:hypothetical protein
MAKVTLKEKLTSKALTGLTLKTADRKAGAAAWTGSGMVMDLNRAMIVNTVKEFARCPKKLRASVLRTRMEAVNTQYITQQIADGSVGAEVLEAGYVHPTGWYVINDDGGLKFRGSLNTLISNFSKLWVAGWTATKIASVKDQGVKAAASITAKPAKPAKERTKKEKAIIALNEQAARVGEIAKSVDWNSMTLKTIADTRKSIIDLQKQLQKLAA